MIGVVKLGSGEELICEYEIKGDVVFCKDIVSMAMVEKDRLGFIPYMPYCDLDNGVEIDRKFVVLIAPLNDHLEAAYRESFNKLLVPTKPKLLVEQP